MKLILTLFILASTPSFGQWCFTRAELEAAADSALFGQQAVITEGDLRLAIVSLLRQTTKHREAANACRELSEAQARQIAAAEVEGDRKDKEIAKKDRKIAKGKPWEVIGKVAVGVVAVATVVGAVVIVKREVE